MKIEIIRKIDVTDNGELVLLLIGTGSTEYQHIYRGAAGVYWDPKISGFKSTQLLGDWSTSDWFFHIKEIAKSEFGIDLKLSNNLEWGEIPKRDRNQIVNGL